MGNARGFLDFKRMDFKKIAPKERVLNYKEFTIPLDKKEQEIASLKGENIDINFGSQIRNYVLEPYKLIKDLRSGYETSNVNKVLDGDLQPIIESLLKMRKNEN